MKQSKIRTKFVVGGQYRRERGGSIQYGTIVAAEQKPNGRRVGRLVVFGEVDGQVPENSDDLDEWELMSEPVSVEMLRRIEEALYKSEPPVQADTTFADSVAALKRRKAT